MVWEGQMSLVDSFNSLSPTSQTAIVLMVFFLIACIIVAGLSFLMLARNRK